MQGSARFNFNTKLSLVVPLSLTVAEVTTTASDW
jgi:hypothetical protein